MVTNADSYSTVLAGHKMIVVVCDNGGHAVISRLQEFKGVPGFNNLLKDCRITDKANPLHDDFATHAAAMGAASRHVTRLADLASALEWAKGNHRMTVISIATEAYSWVPGDADWDVGMPEVSTRDSVKAAWDSQIAIRAKQRIGV
jgi:3D-(3,5/4)-trihydroxycyclohexane-1,2-dione acylhydrolase (decyclizing)